MNQTDRKRIFIEERLRSARALAVQPHDDNTGALCRIDLFGHDCCYRCNSYERVLKAIENYLENHELVPLPSKATRE